ncbi:hypothetical protein LTR95_014517 [Oleoguttula sp. CCFEE 5521]
MASEKDSQAIDDGAVPVHVSLLAVARSLFGNEQYSDKVVKCGKREWKVHKALVLPQIEILAKAFNGGFKEGEENVYTFSDTDPAAVHALLQFVYHGDYSANNNDAMSSSVLHLHVFNLAEQYLLDALRDLAASKFKAYTERLWDQPDFAVAIDIIYTLDAGGNGDLKVTLLDIGRKHITALMRNPNLHADFHEVVRRVPAYLADVHTELATHSSEMLTEVVCPSATCCCVFAVSLSATETTNLWCPECSISRQISKWKTCKREV